MSTKAKPKILAYIVALLTVLVWGETFVSSKILLGHGLRPADIFAYRFGIAYLGMWLISRKNIFCKNWKDELKMLLLGITGGSLYFLTENSALEYSTASNVAIILCATPLATSFLMALFFKDERMKRSQFVGSFIAILGLALIIFNGEVVLKLNPLGDNLALGAVLCWGSYSVLMKFVTGRYDTAFITRKVFGYGLLTIVPYFAVCGWPWNAGTGAGAGSMVTEPVVWGNLLYLGIVASLVCFLAWNWALRELGTVRTTNLLYLQPFFTMVIGYLLLGERITWMAVAGVIILIAGVYRVVR